MSTFDPIPGKPYVPYVRAFFSSIRQVAKGIEPSVSVEELAGSLPLNYKTPSDRARLEARKDIVLDLANQLLVSGHVPFSTTVNFVQENFPPDNRNQDIRARIPADTACTFNLTDSSIELTFNDGARPFVDFPGHPTLVGEYLVGVKYNGQTVEVFFESLSIVVDLSKAPPNPLKASNVFSDDDWAVKTIRILDKRTNEARRTLHGFYKIECAHVENTQCDAGDSQCVRSRCVNEIRYEGDEIEVPDNASDAEVQRIIDQACQSKRAEVDDNCDQLAVTWVTSGGPKITVVKENSGSCLGTSVPVPPGGCAVATTFNGDPEMLSPFYRFRDSHLSKSVVGRKFIQWYYSASPLINSVCRQSKIAKLSREWMLRVVGCVLSRLV
jgi:hypothetical protein